MSIQVKSLAIFALYIVAFGTFLTWWQAPRHANLLTSTAVKQIQHYDESVQTKFTELWNRINRLIDDIKPAAANATKLVGLRPPAKIEEIESLEKKLGYRLPGALKSSLLVHNGSEGEFLDSPHRIYSIERIIDSWDMHTGIVSDFMEYGIEPDPADSFMLGHPGWIPVAGWDSNDLIINLENGKVYETDETGHATFVTNSWQQWLATAADRLENGELTLILGQTFYHAQYAPDKRWTWITKNYYQWFVAPHYQYFQHQ